MEEVGIHTKKIELIQETAPDQTPSPQYLCVDETKRPRANSDPVGLHIHINAVPEITVTGDDCRAGGFTDEDESDSFLIPPSPRRRANTCPEDMFRARKGRPPTPPPEDLRILKNSTGKRFSFNFGPKDIGIVSFAHHRLSKVSEEKAEQKVGADNRCGLSEKGRSSSRECSKEAVQTIDITTTGKDSLFSRIQSHPDETEARTGQSCDQCISTQMSSLSVNESIVSDPASSSNPLSDKVLTSSPDSWISSDNSRDNLDTQRLAAY